jgi:acyl carrier protein
MNFEPLATDKQSPRDDLLRALYNNHDVRPLIQKDMINNSQKFREDLGLDSMAMILIFVDLTQNYPQLNESVISTWKSIDDCLNTLSEHRQTEPVSRCNEN